RQMLVVPLVIATSAVAAGVCLFATRVRTQAGNLIWTWFGAAAITTTLSQLVGYLPPTNLSMMTSHALYLASYVVFFVGLVVAFVFIALVFCALRQGWSLFACMGMWMGITYAAGGDMGVYHAPLTHAEGERLRALVAPTVAIVLATISIEAGFKPPVGPRTGF